MSHNTFRRIYPLAAAISSGALLTFAFPKYDLGWIGWFAIVPLLISILGRNAWLVFFTSLIFGVSFFTGVFSWIFDVPGYKIHHHFFLGLYLDKWIGTRGIFVTIFTLLGVIGGAVTVYRQIIEVIEDKSDRPDNGSN